MQRRQKEGGMRKSIHIRHSRRKYGRRVER